MKYLLFVFLLVGQIYTGSAQDFPKQPYPPRIVNDFAGILSKSQQQELETKLTAFNDSTTTQIAVVTVNSLHGYDPNDYAVRLLDLWGIGQKGRDNGILILIKPKTNNERGQATISVGYGLEAVVPDAIADMIIAREMIPSFQEDDYYVGIDKATDVLFQLTRNEYSAEDYRNRNTEDDGGIFPILLILIIILIIVYFSGRKGRRRGIRSGGTPFFPVGGGSFSRGSSSGGGFGGFGGGRGGGGGASRSW